MVHTLSSKNLVSPRTTTTFSGGLPMGVISNEPAWKNTSTLGLPEDAASPGWRTTSYAVNLSLRIFWLMLGSADTAISDSMKNSATFKCDTSRHYRSAMAGRATETPPIAMWLPGVIEDRRWKTAIPESVPGGFGSFL